MISRQRRDSYVESLAMVPFPRCLIVAIVMFTIGMDFISKYTILLYHLPSLALVFVDLGHPAWADVL